MSVSDGKGGTCSITLIQGAGGCAIPESAGRSPYVVTATYSGDSFFAPATGGLNETVVPAGATVVVTPSSDPANEGPVTYTVLVTGGASTPTGSATVSDGQAGTCTTALSNGLGNCAITEVGLTSPFTITATYSGDSNYAPSEVSLTDARGVSSSPTGTALAILGQTSATATGLGTVNILQYQSNPVGPPTYSSIGVYFDVAGSEGNSFSSEVIQDCDLNGGNQLVWWNPAANVGVGGWQPVVGDPGPIYTTGTPACLSATLDANSSPSISQLSGTVFGLAATPSTPSFTSTNYVEIQTGAKVHVPIATTGVPAPSIRVTGTLPTGVTFHDDGNGTALISGTAPAQPNISSVTLTATNSHGTATQTFFIQVGTHPVFTSAASTILKEGITGSFVVGTSGSPTSSLSETGTLPRGVTFTDNGNGKATLAGTPATGTMGTYKIVLLAQNGISPDATQDFTLTVDQVPTFSSVAAATFIKGKLETFTVKATGFPTLMHFTEAGALPEGVTLSSAGVLSGTPTATGTFAFTITARNGVLPNATQLFTLTVGQAPVFTSASTSTLTHGVTGTFHVTATGFPVPGKITETGTLSAGLAFTSTGGGLGILTGKTSTKGTFTLTFKVTNLIGTTSQTFKLVVK